MRTKAYRAVLTIAAVVLLGAAITPTASALTLITPSGQPVPATWQEWLVLGGAKVPLVGSTIILEQANPTCGTFPTVPPPDGCSGLTPSPYVAVNQQTTASIAQYALYYELGHQFDWQFLTGSERRYLARQWRATRYRWADSKAAVAVGWEDGLEGIFPMIYADCAQGVNDMGSEIMAQEPAGLHFTAPVVRPQIDTCAWLWRIWQRTRSHP